MRHLLKEDPPRKRAPAGAAAADSRLLEAARRFEDLRARVEPEHREPVLRAPSAHPGEEPPKARRAGSGAPPVSRAVAQVGGTAVHLLLEVWDRRDPGWLAEQAERAVAAVLAEETEESENDGGGPIDPARVAEHVRALIDSARRSGRLEALARWPVLGREVPVLYRDAAGTVWQGTVDLIAGAEEDPEVVDFKTDAGLEEGELLERYRGQLERYAEALRLALGREVSPRLRIVALGAGGDPGP